MLPQDNNTNNTPPQDPSDPNQAVQAAGMNEMNQKLSELSERETEELVKSFQDHFNDCTKACKKPNILVAGITGAGRFIKDLMILNNIWIQIYCDEWYNNNWMMII